MQRAPAAQIVEHARHALPQVLGRDAELVGAFLYPGQGGVQAGVLHLHPAPGFEAERLPRRQGDLAQHLEPKVLAAFLLVAPPCVLAARHLPHFRDQRPRERLVALQPIVEMRDEIADGPRAVPDALRHEGAQPEAARVVLHPAGLERGVLPIVAEHQQPRPLGAVHHVLGQHVHVRHVDGADRPGRFPVPAAVRGAARRSARQAARQESGALLVLADGEKPHRVPAAAAGEAAGHRGRVGGAATAAEVEGGGTGMGGGCLPFFVFPDQGVDEHDPPAAKLLLLVLPAGSPRAGVAAPRGPPGEGEVPEERGVVVLPADGARGDWKLCQSFVALRGRAVVRGREPQPRTVALRREGHDGPADAAHESMHDRPQQRPSVVARRGAEGQPGEDLGFGDRPPHSGLQRRRQLFQGPRGRQLLVQSEDDLVAGQRRVQHLRPITRGQLLARQCTVDVPDVRSGRGVFFHGEHHAVENRGGVFPGRWRDESTPGPDLGLVVLPDRRHRVGPDAEETRGEVAPRLRIVVIDDGRRGRDARRAAWIGPAERAKTPDEAGRLRPQRAGERMRFVEHQEIEPRAGEELDVLLPRQQQLELLDVGEENLRLSSRGAHDLARADLLGRTDRLAAAVAPRLSQPGLVVGPRRPRGQPDPGYPRFVLRRLADVHPERNARARQQPAQPHELVFGQRVHRIDDDGADARRGVFVPQAQAPADDGVEEALGLARAGAGGDQGGSAFGDRAQGAFLVAVEVGQRLGDPFAQMGMQQSLANQGVDRRSLPERPRQTHVGALEQRRPAGLVERQQLAHLRVQPGIGERIRRELVAQEAADDVLGVGDGVQGHRTLSASLDELLNGEADVSRDATQQDGRQIPTTVYRNGRAAPVGVAELLVRATLAHLLEAERGEDGDDLAGPENGQGRHSIRPRRRSGCPRTRCRVPVPRRRGASR